MSWKTRPPLAYLVIVGITTTLLMVSSTSEPGDATNGTVTGTVYNDIDVDGVKDAGESGVAGVEIRGFDSVGNEVGSTTTASDGTYTLTATNAATLDVRIEFETPDGWSESFATNGGTTVQFVTLGHTGVNVGMHESGQYCQANPLTACTIVDRTVDAGFVSVRTFKWDNTGGTTNIATNTDTGAVWGLAWQQQTGTLISAPTVRRNTKVYESPTGTPRLGQLFTSSTTAGSTLPYIDVTALGVDVGTIPNWTTRTTAVNGVVDGFYPDGTWDLTGKVGIGDIDVSEDGEHLWFVNLHDRSLYRLDIGAPMKPAASLTASDVTRYALPNPGCSNGLYRPWAVATRPDGSVFVGGVCTGENGGARADLEAIVYRYDPSTDDVVGTPVLRFSLDYAKDNAHVSGLGNTLVGWTAWWDQPNTSGTWYSTTKGAMPILSDIEFTSDGSMTLGFLDRMAHRAQTYNQKNSGLPGLPGETNWFWTSAGDVLRACTSDELTWQIEPIYSTTTKDCVASGVTRFTQRAQSGSQRGGTFEFYNDNAINYGLISPEFPMFGYQGHLESATGGLATYPRATAVAGSFYDTNGAFFTNGVRWWRNDTGNKLTDRTVSTESNNGGNSFGKAGGLGDLQVLCDAAPLQIGDRLWYDLDGDGIQDPGESGIAGVTVRLYDTNNTLVSTAVTDANGHYRFSSTLTKPATGDGGADGGNLQKFSEYQIRLDNPADFGTGPIGGLSLSDANGATNSLTDREDAIDSDAILSSGATYGVDQFPQLTVPPLKPGENNHSFDFGFMDPAARVGDRVWHDLDRDGVQDPGEPGISGVMLSITNIDGSPVTDIDGNPVGTTTSDADGNYQFAKLPAGQYRVVVVSPNGYTASTSTTATSGLLAIGDQDQTLDFGFYMPAVSVGDRVWFDSNQDGMQDVGELGFPGATVSITTSDGSSVLDVTGQAVTNTSTDASGNYTFDFLPPGSYTVTISTPAGLVLTTASAQTGSAPSDGDRNSTLDFGLYAPTVSVGDRVWFDLNRDGIQDNGESGLAGVTLTITNADGTAVLDVFGNPVTTTMTDSGGNYLFDNLPLGQYKVTISSPSDVIPTEKNATTGHATSTSLVIDGEQDLSLDFGYVVPAVSVGDRVWLDLDANGQQDAGEPGIAGVTLTITNADGTAVSDVFGNPVTTTVTDSGGNYLFDDLPFGQYKVTVNAPGSLTASGTNATTSYVTSMPLATDGAQDLSLDFGYVPSVSVGDFVWFDENQDGVQDAGEPGIGGVTLTITNADGTAVSDVFGNPVTTTVTDSGGNYSFDDLPYGEYTVTVTAPNGVTSTTTTFVTSRILSVNGDQDLTLDFGFYAPSVSVGDFVWFDEDQDGVQDAGEPGIGGVTLTITNADGTAVSDVFGNPVTTTVSDSNGQYRFDSLPFGSYMVTVTVPNGFTPSGPFAAAGSSESMMLMADGTSDMTLDFGYHLPVVTVGGTLWTDGDEDGIQDAGEPGIGGVTLTITNADGTAVSDVFGNPVTTVTTNAQGDYSFRYLPPGQYQISSVVPSGRTATTPITVTSVVLLNGQRDMSLDIGFSAPATPPVSSGSDSSSAFSETSDASVIPEKWTASGKSKSKVANRIRLPQTGTTVRIVGLAIALLLFGLFSSGTKQMLSARKRR